MSQTPATLQTLITQVETNILSKNYDKALELVDQLLKNDEKNIFALAYRERIFLLSGKIEKTVQPQNVQRLSLAISESYNTLLMEVWKDGIVSDVEHFRLDNLRSILAINEETHNEIEFNVRKHYYLKEYKQEWQNGSRKFDHLISKFRLAPKEIQQLKPDIDELMRKLLHPASVLVLDDDPNFLLWTKTILEKNNYLCITAKTPEDGLKILASNSVDVILCDIAFGNMNMNGFAFYQELRKNNSLRFIPFIVVTGLTQNSFLVTSRKLGIDDYMLKPIDSDLLLAIIQGKLRRIQEIQNS